MRECGMYDQQSCVDFLLPLDCNEAVLSALTLFFGLFWIRCFVDEFSL